MFYARALFAYDLYAHTARIIKHGELHLFPYRNINKMQPIYLLHQRSDMNVRQFEIFL